MLLFVSANGPCPEASVKSYEQQAEDSREATDTAGHLHVASPRLRQKKNRGSKRKRGPKFLCGNKECFCI